MKEYKTNEELIDYLSSKGVVIADKEAALKKIERYTYYSIINSYKSIFKDKNNNYINDVSFDEIYALFEFDKNLKNIMLKFCLEIETVIKSAMANQISKVYGIKDYLNISNWDNSIDDDIKEVLFEKINNEIESTELFGKDLLYMLIDAAKKGEYKSLEDFLKDYDELFNNE